MNAADLVANPVVTIAPIVLAEARARWKLGDRFFLARQLEMFQMRVDECGCPQNTCGGCVTCLGIAAVVLADWEKCAESKAPEVQSERETARWRWRSMREAEGRAARESHSHAVNQERAQTKGAA